MRETPINYSCKWKYQSITWFSGKWYIEIHSELWIIYRFALNFIRCNFERIIRDNLFLRAENFLKLLSLALTYGFQHIVKHFGGERKTMKTFVALALTLANALKIMLRNLKNECTQPHWSRNQTNFENPKLRHLSSKFRKGWIICRLNVE